MENNDFTLRISVVCLTLDLNCVNLRQCCKIINVFKIDGSCASTPFKYMSNFSNSFHSFTINSFKGFSKIVQMLVGRDAKLDIVNKNGLSVLDAATHATKGNLKTISTAVNEQKSWYNEEQIFTKSPKKQHKNQRKPASCTHHINIESSVCLLVLICLSDNFY